MPNIEKSHSFVSDYRDHLLFLDQELKAQIEAFRILAEQTAISLLQRDEVFVASYLGQNEEGHIVLEFSKKRGLPKKGLHLQALLMPDYWCNYRNWGKASYRKLHEAKLQSSEAVCLWHGESADRQYYIAGFKKVSLDFTIRLVKDCIVILGPQTPPIDYLRNLSNLVLEAQSKQHRANQFLDLAYLAPATEGISPTYQQLKKGNEISMLQAQLELEDAVIIQGPPGTGKTVLMAKLAASLANIGKSVLVTALTNRALIELASKSVLAELSTKGKVAKTNLSTDEKVELPQLQALSQLSPISGGVSLSSFYIASYLALELQTQTPSFDYVIMDEASQAVLATFAMCAYLGKKLILVGDTHQLPAVIVQNQDKVKNIRFVEGMKTSMQVGSFPAFFLSTTYRLTPRACSYTNIFYQDLLQSGSSNTGIKASSPLLRTLLHPASGPVCWALDMPSSSKVPKVGVAAVTAIIRELIAMPIKPSFVVLTPFLATTKAIQKEVAHLNEDIMVNTVSSVQGLTTDIVIYLIPNSSLFFSLEPKLFNVATSRARHHTILIIPDTLDTFDGISLEVKMFFNYLKADSGWFEGNVKLLHN